MEPELESMDIDALTASMEEVESKSIRCREILTATQAEMRKLARDRARYGWTVDAGTWDALCAKEARYKIASMRLENARQMIARRRKKLRQQGSQPESGNQERAFIGVCRDMLPKEVYREIWNEVARRASTNENAA